MGEQNTMENDARVKRNELFNPIEKKTTKMIDEYSVLLSKKISDVRKATNKKPVKIWVVYSDAVANSDGYVKNDQSLDITASVILFIKNKNTQDIVEKNSDKKINIAEKLKDKSNKKK